MIMSLLPCNCVMFVYIAYNLVMLLFFFIPLPFMVNKRFSNIATLLVKCKWSTIQLYSTVNPVQSDEKLLIMVSVHEECYFFVFYTG